MRFVNTMMRIKKFPFKADVKKDAEADFPLGIARWNWLEYFLQKTFLAHKLRRYNCLITYQCKHFGNKSLFNSINESKTVTFLTSDNIHQKV